MAVTLSDGEKKQALASLSRFCEDELEFEMSGVQSALLLKFILAEIAPSVYNSGVRDAQAFLQDRLADLEATCYEAEFAYWPKGASVRRKR